MPCSHEHHGAGGCNHDDDDHLKQGDGQQDILYSQIDKDSLTALNEAVPGSVKNVIKPWDARMSEETFIESDADDQLIIRVVFTGSVKLRSIIMKAGPGGQTPDEIRLFPNIEAFDFDDASEATPAQSLSSIAVAREAVEYPVRAAKFSSVRSLTLFVPRSVSEPTTRIYFLGFRGEFFNTHREGPTNIVYESALQVKDHAKVPGTEAGANVFGPGPG